MLTWISACPYKRQHQDVLGGEAIMENTGEWLFKTNEFIDWIETPGTSVLWLNGERTSIAHSLITVYTNGDRTV